jgi:hypothetical protein
MNIEKGYLYHIYNQGNNRQKIFFKEEKQYPQMCFNYMHQNPVKAELVKNAKDRNIHPQKTMPICKINN